MVPVTQKNKSFYQNWTKFPSWLVMLAIPSVYLRDGPLCRSGPLQIVCTVAYTLHRLLYPFWDRACDMTMWSHGWINSTLENQHYFTNVPMKKTISNIREYSAVLNSITHNGYHPLRIAQLSWISIQIFTLIFSKCYIVTERCSATLYCSKCMQ